MNEIKLVVGGSLEVDAAAFVKAWHGAGKAGERQANYVTFESWDKLVSVLSPERFRLLRHVHKSPALSISALARALGRPYRRVHGDVAALAHAGLLEKAGGEIRAVADGVSANISFAEKAA